MEQNSTIGDKADGRKSNGNALQEMQAGDFSVRLPGDREECLEAGASDHLAKPVNIHQLLSALRMWLHR